MGWTRLDMGPDTYVLTAHGPPTSVRLIGFTTPDGVGLATQMAFRSHRSRLSWVPIAPIHRAFARDFLDRAVQRQRAAAHGPPTGPPVSP